MAGKSKTKRNWQNIKINMSHRLERAKRKGKSENYVHDLELALSKRR